MKSYWNTLNERERWMVVAAVLCAILYCYYLFVYAPLERQVTQKSSQLVEKVTTLEWMKKVKQQHHKSKKKQSVDNSQLLTILATQLKDDATLKFPYQLQQTGSGEIQLTFDAVAFNLFVAWLEKISEKYAINLKQFNAERTPTPGVAHITILISAV